MAMKKYALQTVSVCEGSEEILSEKLFDTREEAEAFRNVLEQVTNFGPEAEPDPSVHRIPHRGACRCAGPALKMPQPNGVPQELFPSINL